MMIVNNIPVVAIGEYTLEYGKDYLKRNYPGIYVQPIRVFYNRSKYLFGMVKQFNHDRLSDLWEKHPPVKFLAFACRKALHHPLYFVVYLGLHNRLYFTAASFRAGGKVKNYDESRSLIVGNFYVDSKQPISIIDPTSKDFDFDGVISEIYDHIAANMILATAELKKGKYVLQPQ